MALRRSRKRRSPCRYGRKKSLRQGCKSRPGPKRKSPRRVRRSRRKSPRRVRRSRRKSPRRSRRKSPRRVRRYNFAYKMEEADICSICQEIPTDPVTTPCGHTFCKACLNRWIQQKCPDPNDIKCPMCRRVIDIGWRNDNNLRCVIENELPSLEEIRDPAFRNAWLRRAGRQPRQYGRSGRQQSIDERRRETRQPEEGWSARSIAYAEENGMLPLLRAPPTRFYPVINSAWRTAENYESPFSDEPQGPVRWSKEIFAQLLNERGYTREQQVRVIQDLAATESTYIDSRTHLWNVMPGEIRLVQMALVAVDLALGKDTHACGVSALLSALCRWDNDERGEGGVAVRDDERLLGISVSQFSHLVA